MNWLIMKVDQWILNRDNAIVSSFIIIIIIFFMSLLNY